MVIFYISGYACMSMLRPRAQLCAMSDSDGVIWRQASQVTLITCIGIVSWLCISLYLEKCPQSQHGKQSPRWLQYPRNTCRLGAGSGYRCSRAGSECLHHVQIQRHRRDNRRSRRQETGLTSRGLNTQGQATPHGTNWNLFSLHSRPARLARSRPILTTMLQEERR